MEKLSKSTSSMPLMLNFVKSQKMKVVKEEDIALIYDPVSQITMFMGGGSSKKSRSMTETKETVTGGTRGPNGFIPDPRFTKQDHSYGADD